MKISEAKQRVGREGGIEMVQGVKGYPKLNYVHNKQDNSWKFSKEDLAEYRYWWDRSRKKRT